VSYRYYPNYWLCYQDDIGPWDEPWNDGDDYGPEDNEYLINYINYNEDVNMNVEYDENIEMNVENDEDVGDEDVRDKNDEDVVDKEPKEVPYWYYPNYWLFNRDNIGHWAPWDEPWNDGDDYVPKDNEYLINCINYNENVDMNLENDEDVDMNAQDDENFEDEDDEDVGDEDDKDVVYEEPEEVSYYYYPNYWLNYPDDIGQWAPWDESLNDGNDYGPEYNEYIINYINYNENVEMNVEYDEDVGDKDDDE
jgi:hypothetical protein